MLIEWSSLNHAVVTAAIRQWRRRLSACVQDGGGHFEHHFSHPLSICRLVDLFDAKMCELTRQIILLCDCSLSLNVCNIGLQCNLRVLSTTVLQGSVATWVNDGMIFSDSFIANLPLSVMVKEF